MSSTVKHTLLCALLLLVLATAAGQTLRFSVSPSELKPGDKGMLRATVSFPDSMKQSYDPSEGESPYFFLSGDSPALSFGKLSYPKPTKVSSDGFWVYHNSVTLSLPFTVKANAKPGKVAVNATFGYNLCHKTTGFCGMPSEESRQLSLQILPGDAASPAASVDEESLEEQPSGEEPAARTEPAAEAEKPTDGKTSTGSILFYMLMAILGGIVLNFTPCVLPILPIRAMSMVNQAQKDVTKVLLHTLVYTLGVLISFGSIAAVFIIARLSGVNLTYGFLSQSLTYNLIMLSILFLFGLSLLGVWQMTLPGMNAAAKTSSKKGYAGSFFGGIFAFLMGFSCMGPFMGPALEVAVRLSSPLLMIFFLLIGFGFALPFILISLFPKALKLIPKPGEWMNIFKEVMGFLLLLLTWKYFSNIWGLTKSGVYLLDTAHFVVFLGFAAWLYGRFVRVENSKAVQYIFTLLTLAVIVFAAWNYLPWKEKHVPPQSAAALVDGMQPADHEGWYVFTPELFDRLQAEGKTVFLDIGAAWCTNCKTNEKKVLHQEDIAAEFKKLGVVTLKGDFTNGDPVLKDWIQKGGSIGVPFNVLYIPGQEPVKMPELFSKKDLLDALSRVPAREGK